MPNQPTSEFFFRGGGTALKPHHKTRYIYPSKCGYDLKQLRLHTPHNYQNRRRPQGEGAYDTTFLTITSAGRQPPTLEEFNQRMSAERRLDKESTNPIGRAMRRVVAYAGNTVLEMGKFKLGSHRLVYVIKRTTMIELSGDGFGRDEDDYEIPCQEWRSLCPESLPGHDSWWRRLNDLLYCSTDRAFYNVKHQLDNVLFAAAPIVQWQPRSDIPQVMKIGIDPKSLDETDECCNLCMSDWIGPTAGEVPCTFPCGHAICLACLEHACDHPKRMEDKDAGGNETGTMSSLIVCPFCRTEAKITVDREDLIGQSEMDYWRWRYMGDRLNEVNENWLAYFDQSVAHGYIPGQPPDAMGVLDAGAKVKADDVIAFMGRLLAPAYAMLPCGYKRDNPANFRETEQLHRILSIEIVRLQNTGQLYKRNDLSSLFKEAADKLKPVLKGTKEERLGNPEWPPGFELYKEYLCKWLAYGCFMCPSSTEPLFHLIVIAEHQPGQKYWPKGELFGLKLSRFEPTV